MHLEAHISKLCFRSSAALLRLLFGSQAMLREQATPKTGRTTPVVSWKRYADAEIMKGCLGRRKEARRDL